MNVDDNAGVGLSPYQINKYNWRVEKFVDYIWNFTPFELTSKKLLYPISVTVDGVLFTPNNSDRVDAINAILNIRKNRRILVSGYVDNELVNVVSSHIVKTSDFGGKTSDQSLRVENMMLADIKNQLTVALDNNNGNPINVIVGQNIYVNIVDVETTPGTPKSDFHFIDDSNESKVFVSHKAGKNGKGFQQYSGVSKFYDHSEVFNFISDIKVKYGDIVTPKANVYREVDDPHLICQSIYGHDFGDMSFGINNVHGLFQGHVKLVPADDTSHYKLEADNVLLNGEVPEHPNFEPIFCMTYRKGKQNKMIQNGRVGIYPKSFKTKTSEKI